MKKAFTMIELIFVIVIIGILAAVAIPKLSATRDDAKIANIIANARTLSRDATSYYTAQGANVWDTAKVISVSSVPVYTDTACSTFVVSADNIQDIFYLCDEADGNPCLTFDINATAINILSTSAGISGICDGVIVDPAIIGMTGGTDNNKSIVLGGVGTQR